MPVSTTRTQTEQYTLARLYIDMEAGAAQAYFKHVVDGARQADLLFEATAQEYGALLAAPGDSTRPRGYDIADAVYNLALQRGFITGEIEPDMPPQQPEQQTQDPAQPGDAPADGEGGGA